LILPFLGLLLFGLGALLLFLLLLDLFFLLGPLLLILATLLFLLLTLFHLFLLLLLKQFPQLGILPLDFFEPLLALLRLVQMLRIFQELDDINPV
jgi:hypothetical protein